METKAICQGSVHLRTKVSKMCHSSYEMPLIVLCSRLLLCTFFLSRRRPAESPNLTELEVDGG